MTQLEFDPRTPALRPVCTLTTTPSALVPGCHLSPIYPLKLTINLCYKLKF